MATMNKRFSAKLAYEYRVLSELSEFNAGYTFDIESRIVIIMASSAETAYTKAVKYGQKNETCWDCADGGQVAINFLGIVELMKMDCTDENEVWYEFEEGANGKPIRVFIPRKTSLDAFQYEKYKNQTVNPDLKKIKFLCIKEGNTGQTKKSGNGRKRRKGK